MSNNYIGIMAGGIGSRFWPMSKTRKPKQFLDILGTGKSLIQQTVARFEKIVPSENIFILSNASYRGILKEQLPHFAIDQFVEEPTRRNTAPCIAYFAHKIYAKNKDANLVIAPSDHLILEEQNFCDTISKALNFTASNDQLLTLGIVPSRPDTGYGYIQYQSNTEVDENLFKVKLFTEKPNLEMAQQFINSGDFLWNSGIFIWNAKTIIEAFKENLNEVHLVFKEGESKFNTPEEKQFIEKAYSLCTNISIDYAIMEKANNVLVIPSSFGWSDLGTWASMYENIEKEENGNGILGENISVFDAHNNIIVNDDEIEKLVIVSDVEDLIIVNTNKVVMIAKKSEEQKVKKITKAVNDAYNNTFA